jgi:crotonobetainyl-CoA:carnitine CoA-transferase CaiB-like acyl-CoA transferase
VLAREMVITMQHPQMGEVRTVGSPYKLSNSKVSYRFPPPLMGEHTDAVLTEVLGLSEAEIATLRDAGAI